MMVAKVLAEGKRPTTKQIRRDWQPLVASNDEEILYTSIHLKGGLLLEGYP
jgi:hypothetical protein